MGPGSETNLAFARLKNEAPDPLLDLTVREDLPVLGLRLDLLEGEPGRPRRALGDAPIARDAHGAREVRETHLLDRRPPGAEGDERLDRRVALVELASESAAGLEHALERSVRHAPAVPLPEGEVVEVGRGIDEALPRERQELEGRRPRRERLAREEDAVPPDGVAQGNVLEEARRPAEGSPDEDELRDLRSMPDGVERDQASERVADEDDALPGERLEAFPEGARRLARVAAPVVAEREEERALGGGLEEGAVGREREAGEDRHGVDHAVGHDPVPFTKEDRRSASPCERAAIDPDAALGAA